MGPGLFICWAFFSEPGMIPRSGGMRPLNFFFAVFLSKRSGVRSCGTVSPVDFCHWFKMLRKCCNVFLWVGSVARFLVWW